VDLRVCLSFSQALGSQSIAVTGERGKEILVENFYHGDCSMLE
jgi:hypothetical protein